MTTTYKVHLSDAGNPVDGVFDRDDGVQVLAGDPDLQAWLDAGNVPTTPIWVPPTVTNYQARSALIDAGLFTQADTAVHASNDAKTIAAWDYANNFYRDSTFIATMAKILNIQDAEVDALFIAASKVV